MKAEDRIIELLIEYIQKTDRILERLPLDEKAIDQHSKQIAKQGQQIENLYQLLLKQAEHTEKNSEEIKQLRQESLKREVQNQAVLQEIFSISKRVSRLEDQK